MTHIATFNRQRYGRVKTGSPGHGSTGHRFWQGRIIAHYVRPGVGPGLNLNSCVNSNIVCSKRIAYFWYTIANVHLVIVGVRYNNHNNTHTHTHAHTCTRAHTHTIVSRLYGFFLAPSPDYRHKFVPTQHPNFTPGPDNILCNYHYLLQ